MNHLPVIAPRTFPRTVWWFAAPAVLGLAASMLAVELSGLETKFLVAATAAIVLLVGLLGLRTPRKISNVMVVALTLGLSLGLHKSFFLQFYVQGSHVLWAQGAAAVTITLTLLGAIGYLTAQAADAYFYGHRRRIVMEPSLLLAALLYMAVGALSLINAEYSALVFLEEIRLATLLFICVVVMNFSRADLDLFLKILALSILIQAAIGVLQFAFHKNLGLSIFGEEDLTKNEMDLSSVTRITGTIGHPNFIAYFFEITLPLMLALACVSARRWERWLYGTATVAGLAGLLMTQSRGGWLTVPVTVGFVLFTVLGRRMLSLRAAVVGLFIVLSIAAASIYVAPLISRRLLADDAGSVSTRIPLDLAAISVIEQFPLLGVGLNNFAVSFHQFDTTGYSRYFQGYDLVVHNLLLLEWGDVGTLGLLAFLWYFGSALLVARGVAASGDRWSRAVALGAAVGLFGHLIHGQFDPGFKLTLTISQLIAAQIGLIGCLACQLRRHPAENRLVRVAVA